MDTVLQIPVSSSLRTQSLHAAKQMGFSSLQEAVRVFLTQFSQGKVALGFHHPDAIVLSDAAKKRYAAIDKDFHTKKNIASAKNLNQLMEQLNED